MSDLSLREMIARAEEFQRRKQMFHKTPQRHDVKRLPERAERFLRDFVENNLPNSEDLAKMRLAEQGSVMGDFSPMIERSMGVMGAGALSVSRAARLRRMVEQGYTRGFFRGGKSVADGPFFTPVKPAAEDFAKRHGPDADVREYAIRLGRSLKFGSTYSADDIADIVKEVRKIDPKIADELAQMPGDWDSSRIPGEYLYQALKMSTPDAPGLLARAGFDTIDAGQEIVTLHKRGLVRDPERAMFDPKKTDNPSPFAAVGAAPLFGHSEE